MKKTISSDDLRQWRNKAGMTQQELADAMSVSLRTIAGWESRGTGAFKLAPEKAKKLSDILDLDGEELSKTTPTPIHDERKQVSVRVSGTALLGYDAIQARHGLSQQELVEAAPMLFEVLHHLLLEKRKETALAVQEHLNAVSEVMDTEAYGLAAVLPAGAEALRHIAEELEAIEHREAFTRSYWRKSGNQNVAAGNRFNDLLQRMEFPRSDLVLERALLEVDNLPESIVGLGVLAELFEKPLPLEEHWDDGQHIYHNIMAWHHDELISDNEALMMFTVLAGDVRLRDIPKEFRSDDKRKERHEWVMKATQPFWPKYRDEIWKP